MAHLLGIVAPVFVLIAMGWVAVHRGWLDTPGVRGLSDFTFFAAMPALLFGSIADAPPVRLADVAGSFLAGAVGLFFIALAAGRQALRLKLAPAGMFALNGVYGNTVMMGVPVIQAAYGATGVANLLAVVAFHSAVLLPLATLMIETGQGMRPGVVQTLRSVGRGLFTNPVVLSVLLAMLWRALALPVPGPVNALLVLLGGAAAPVALFCLGASLPRPAMMRGHLAGNRAEIAATALLKLAVMPAVVGLIAHAAGVRGIAFSTVVVAAAMPTGANAFLLARRMDTMAENAAGVVLVSTILSVVTLTALLSWLR
jgi:malonate transporter and related proteins